MLEIRKALKLILSRAKGAKIWDNTVETEENRFAQPAYCSIVKCEKFV